MASQYDLISHMTMSKFKSFFICKIQITKYLMGVVVKIHVCVCVCVCMHKKKLISRFHVPQSQCAGEGSRLVRNLELLMPTTDFPGGSLVRNLPAMQESWVQP